MQRVVVTGLGVVSPIGNTRDAFFANLIAGKSGVARLQNLDLTDLPITIGGEVKGLDHAAANVNDKVNARKMDKASIFAVVAAGEALRDAKLDPTPLGDRCGAVIGSGLAGLMMLQEQTENLLSRGPRSVSPFTIPVIMPNAPPANVSLAYGIHGPSYNVASACSSSGHAMIDAFEMIRNDRADVMVTGGTEACMTRLSISAFANMKAMTKKFNDDPEKASRPFDADRDGFVIAEGACIVILESESHAKARGARIYAKLDGYGMTMDAYHLVAPDPSAVNAIVAVKKALAMAGWDPAAIAGDTYVNAHGTSTKFNDLMETVALKSVFGDHARKLRVSSTKSITGHLIGTACALELAACVYALNHGVLPPTINYQTPDPECDLDYIPNEARKADVRYAIDNSFGFGGHNVSIVLSRCDD
ncbi:MAG: beta-ketoacyl-ACP synthase II [Planctomycetia bacterium]